MNNLISQKIKYSCQISVNLLRFMATADTLIIIFSIQIVSRQLCTLFMNNYIFTALSLIVSGSSIV
jgi:hypothetical protein